ncbi:MAG: protein O-mannosyl-transferase family [Gemmatimonadota bacterium]
MRALPLTNRAGSPARWPPKPGGRSPALESGLATAAVLSVIYAATLAPDVTLWDSGEFLSAMKTRGIPHPPGTPLFVMVGAVWTSIAGLVLPFAQAANLLSALVTAAAAGLLAGVVASTFSSRDAGIVAGLAAGSMAAVWQSATETEVYGYAMLLSVGMITAAAQFVRSRKQAWRLLCCYLFGLAVALHLSALVAGPAAIYLLGTDEDGEFRLSHALAPAGAWLLAVGLGTVSVFPLVLGAGLLAESLIRWPGPSWRERVRDALLSAALVTLGTSPILFMMFRAAHDPAINQGMPDTIRALLDVVGRAQYDVPGLWPRRAPLWIQIGNLFQYADWQIASALDDWPGASPMRTPWTLLFIGLAGAGVRWHAVVDRRSFRAFGLLFLSATIGVVVVLNLRAGPSYGWGVLPDGALHEARERDYFFGPAFAIWGMWAGAGAVHLATRVKGRLRYAVGGLALAPIALNWAGVDRTRHPEAVIPSLLGRSILESAEPRAVLFLAGDNDTYSVWYMQNVVGVRRDVTPITIPLLGADWYRRELHRRHDLLGQDHLQVWRGSGPAIRAIATAATAAGRPVNASVAVLPAERDWAVVAGGWTLRGMVFARAESNAPHVDTATTARVAAEIEAAVGRTSGSGDPTSNYMLNLLRCPASAMDVVLPRADAAGAQSHLDRLCPLRLR